MKIQAGDAAEFGCVGQGHATACGDTDAAGCTRAEISEASHSLRDVRFAAGSEDTLAAASQHLVEGRVEIRGMVERAMKGDGEIACELHQRAHTTLIHLAPRGKTASDKTCHAHRGGVLQVVAHDRELCLAVHEISAAWAKQDVDRKPAAGERCAQQTMAGSHAAFT